MREKIDELLRKVYDEGFNDGADVEQGVAGAPDWQDTRASKVADAVLALIGPVMEEAWREGWATGYRSGVTDGGSDSSWCDQEGDWEKSKARAALSPKSEKQDG
jgi:hypothetical protein